MQAKFSKSICPFLKNSTCLGALIIGCLYFTNIKAVSPRPGMILVKGGTFLMGEDPSKENKKKKANWNVGGASYHKTIPTHPAHSVTLGRFFLDKYEVTNQKFRQFVEKHPQWSIPQARGVKGKADHNYLRHWDGGKAPVFATATHPVIYVSWFAAHAYCESQGKRLPTEAEWEKSVRAGTTSIHAFGSSVVALQKHAWFYFNSAKSTHPVQSKEPNPWGFYHLNGNVWEWVNDGYDEGYYQVSPKNNPMGPKSSLWKVIRGGGWYDGPKRLLSVSRDYVRPEYAVEDIGFRCAQTPDS